MTINEVSKKLNITQDTLRFYEKTGLIGPIRRDKSGYRNYQEEDFERLLSNTPDDTLRHQLRLAKRFYRYYQHHIHQQDKILAFQRSRRRLKHNPLDGNLQ